MAKNKLNEQVDVVRPKPLTKEEFRHAWLKQEIANYVDSIKFDSQGFWTQDDMPLTTLKDRQVQFFIGRAMNLLEILHAHDVEKGFDDYTNN